MAGGDVQHLCNRWTLRSPALKQKRPMKLIDTKTKAPASFGRNVWVFEVLGVEFWWPIVWIHDEVQCVRWWMAHFDSRTPKRHFAFGNSRVVLGLDRGVLRKWKPKHGKKVTTAERYTDRSGKHRYKGTSSLKATEKHGFELLFWTMLMDSFVFVFWKYYNPY